MPRRPSFTNDELTERALQQFWTHGYNATSMDALVQSTGVSRHGIYASFGGKKALFEACFARYQDLIVTPAFSVVEAPDADLDSISTYFETQIAGAEANGLPGPGCFVANSATEVAPHMAEVMACVAAHNDRLRAGFLNALTNTTVGVAPANDLHQLAEVSVIFTNGLWAMSRCVAQGDDLRRSVHQFLKMVEGRLA